MTPEISTTDVVFVVVCIAIIWYLVSRCNGKTWVFHERVEYALQTLRDEKETEQKLPELICTCGKRLTFSLYDVETNECECGWHYQVSTWKEMP